MASAERDANSEGKPRDEDGNDEGVIDSDFPEWFCVAEAQGVKFSPPPAIDENPPWLEAAMECGVTFYDPDGNEVVVPSSKVGAFKAGLETVRDFEGSLAETTVTTQADTPSVQEQRPVGKDEGQDAMKQTLKCTVQKLYFVFLREGLEPNDAAARAIREAKEVWARGDYSCGDSQSGNATLDNRQRCASSARGNVGPQSQYTVAEDVAVKA